MALLNGAEATDRVYSRVYLQSQQYARKSKSKQNNTDALKTVHLEGGVQRCDSERLEQPLLTSFVQAGNIN